MKKLKKLDKYRIFIEYILQGIILLAILFLALLGASASSLVAFSEKPTTLGNTYVLGAVAFILYGGLHLLFAYIERRKRIQFFFHIGIGGVLILISILLFPLHDYTFYQWFHSICFILCLFAGRIAKFIDSRNLGGRILNGLLAAVCLLLAVLYMSDNAYPALYMWISDQILGYVSIGLIVRLVFSQVQLGTLRKIVEKTYAKEILAGLLVLIVAFSFVFYLTESAFTNYFDAIWYCFAIVTTIGFGDFATTSIMGRILSIILGFYGIIVVALITSIIVNFYNEVKNDPSDIIKQTVKAVEEEEKRKKQRAETKVNKAKAKKEAEAEKPEPTETEVVADLPSEEPTD